MELAYLGKRSDGAIRVEEVGSFIEPLFRIHGNEWKCLSGKQRTNQVLDSVDRGGFAICTAAHIFCPMLFVLLFLEQKKEFLNLFGEGRLKPF